MNLKRGTGENMHRINIKPLSINCAFQGRRFKTPAYNKYERDCLLLLPAIKIPLPPYRLTIELGFSNKGADLSNPLKLIEDIIQKKYGINDKDVYQIVLNKVIVSKSNEYFKFNLESLNKNM